MAMISVPISKILAVFKRDKFRCQFCLVAPDHRPITIYIKRQASLLCYTTDDLVTGCARCEKDPAFRDSIKEYSLLPQHYLGELPKPKEQISMLVAWQKENIGRNSFLCEELIMHWNDLHGARKNNKEEYEQIYKLMMQFSFNQIEEAMNRAYKQYFGKPATKVSLEEAFSKIGGIAYNIAHPNPNLREVNYIIGTLRNRGVVESEQQIRCCKELINENLEAGVSFEIIRQVARQTKRYSDFIFAVQL